MGALRAAELSGEGMIGAGLIYRWYRRFPLLSDDAVAVAHAPPELGSTPLSAALVDIRRSVRAAERAGLISREAAKEFVLAAEAKPFLERSATFLHAQNISLLSQKAADAETMLNLMHRHQAAGDWPCPTTERPPIVHAWLDDLQAAGCDTNLIFRQK
jgi:hypothetical protein